MTTRIGHAVANLREARGLSRDAVVAALDRMGVTITRSALVNLEVGDRRDSISIGEWFGLAAVLDVPPGALLYPDPVADATVLPTRPPLPGYWALGWISGDRSRIPWDLLSESSEDAERRYIAASGCLAACRVHDDLLFDLLYADADRDQDDRTRRRYREAVTRLAQHRDDMRADSLTLPDLPEDADRAVATYSRATDVPPTPEKKRS